MAQILKFPVPPAKFGYKRVRKRASAENPNQLHLFSGGEAPILALTPELSRFEQALLFDDGGDLKASELYYQAIAAGDRVADAYCNLGIIESKRGNVAKAFDCFTNSLKHDPRHLEAHFNLGNMYFEVKDHRLAQVHYEIAAEIDPSFANVYFNLALVQAINNELARALQTLTRYREMVPHEDGTKTEELLQNLKRSLAGPHSKSHSAVPPGLRQ